MSELQRDRLHVTVLADRVALGNTAAEFVARRLRQLLAQDAARRPRLLFAAAASQVEFLDALGRADGIDWGRIEAFHMDEYVGLPPGDGQAFGAWLDRHIFDVVHPGRVEKLDPTTADPTAECRRYGELLADGGLDLALVGIGENGHVAFNDPHVADFEDPEVVKPVLIDETSRAQQVRDGAFASIALVPRLAMTVTMSTILAARAISCVVPGPTKAAAVARALDGPIEVACPASALRRHPDVAMFIDEAAATGVAH
jgi:glucosamine-6-phosphate deaminase